MDKREQILHTALRLFVENGFHATPTSRIAKEAKVATGTLFHYFKTKEDLINELYLDSKERMLTAIKQNIGNNLSLKAKMKLFFINSTNWVKQHPNDYLFFQTFSNSSFISDETKAIGSEKFAFFNKLIEEGQEAEILKQVPTELLTNMLFATMMGALHLCLQNKNNTQEEYSELAFELIWDMIKG